MPALSIILNSEETAFRALSELAATHGRDTQALLDSGQLVHLSNDAQIEVGALPQGTSKGQPAVTFCFKLPDGKVALIETTLSLLLSAADAFRSAYGDPREGTPGQN